MGYGEVEAAELGVGYVGTLVLNVFGDRARAHCPAWQDQCLREVRNCYTGFSSQNVNTAFLNEKYFQIFQNHLEKCMNVYPAV